MPVTKLAVRRTISSVTSPIRASQGNAVAKIIHLDSRGNHTIHHRRIPCDLKLVDQGDAESVEQRGTSRFPISKCDAHRDSVELSRVIRLSGLVNCSLVREVQGKCTDSNPGARAGDEVAFILRSWLEEHPRDGPWCSLSALLYPRTESIHQSEIGGQGV